MVFAINCKEDQHAELKKDHDLDWLDKILNSDLEERTPLILSLTPQRRVQTWVLAAILATPVILWVLVKKRFGWLISFLLFVLIP